jgi:hypothetical protein
MQSFDAYSGGACGQGGRKLLVASFIAPGSVCVPVSYVSIQFSKPNDPGFTTGFSGTVGFLNTAGTPLFDASSAPVSSANITDTGTVTFPANLNNLAPAVVPIFQVSLLHSGTSYGGDVAVTLTWVSSGDPACTPAGYSVAPFAVSFDLNGPTAATLIETVTQGAQLSTASLQTNQSWNTSGTLTNGLPTTPPTWGSVAFLGWFTSPSGGT